MEQEELFDKIEAYLIGHMTETERADFEKQIAADENLRRDVDYQRIAYDAMDVLNEQRLREKMAKWEVDRRKRKAEPLPMPVAVVDKEETKVDDTKIISLPNRWLRYAAAASVILGVILAGLWWRNVPEPSDVTADKLTKTDSLPTNPTITTEKPKQEIVQTPPTKPNEKPKLPPQYNDFLAYAETHLDEEEFKKDNTTRSENDGRKDDWKRITEAY